MGFKQYLVFSCPSSPLSTYSIRDSTEKRLDIEAAHRRYEQKDQPPLLLPIRLGRSWDCPLASRSPLPLLTRHGASQAGSCTTFLRIYIQQEVAQHPLISLTRGWPSSLTDKYFTHRREFTAGAGLVQRQQPCLHKSLFSPRPRVHLTPSSR